MFRKLLLIGYILLIFSSNLSAITVKYRQGGGSDYIDINVLGTYISSFDKTYTYGNSDVMKVVDFYGYHWRSLVAFPNIFGAGANQVPYGVTINSATLSLTISYADSPATCYLNRSTIYWNEGSSWNSTGGGSWDGYLGQTFMPSHSTFNFDVTDLVQEWVNQTLTNYGWIVYTWDYSCSLFIVSDDSPYTSSRPTLTIDYSFPPEPEPEPEPVPEPSSLILLLTGFIAIFKKCFVK